MNSKAHPALSKIEPILSETCNKKCQPGTTGISNEICPLRKLLMIFKVVSIKRETQKTIYLSVKSTCK